MDKVIHHRNSERTGDLTDCGINVAVANNTYNSVWWDCTTCFECLIQHDRVVQGNVEEFLEEAGPGYIKGSLVKRKPSNPAEIYYAAAQQVIRDEFTSTSTHRVFRYGNGSRDRTYIDCFCKANGDHEIGQEVL